jgi:hypothetical protein
MEPLERRRFTIGVENVEYHRSKRSRTITGLKYQTK